MKNLLILLVIMTLASAEMIAQNVPQGIRYQAVARDLDGTVIIGQDIDVKAELISDDAGQVYYSERHHVVTNNLGLIDLVIGEGTSVGGKFAELPWSTEQIWVRLSVKKSEESSYQIVSSGQLYSVPRAMYAESAGKLIKGEGDDDERNPNGFGSSGSQWSVTGNYDIDEWNDGAPVLGTTDANDLVIVTNNTPRLIVDQNNQVTFLTNVDIDGSMNVDGATTLNDDLSVTNMASTTLSGTLDVAKETTLGGNVTVANMAATTLTGTLDVDKTATVDGATDLNSSLSVTGGNATSLTGTLGVQGTTTLNDDLTVENEAYTYLTGDLEVDGSMSVGGTSVNGDFSVLNMYPTELSGTLRVDKLVTLNQNMSVSGDGTLGIGADHLAYFNNTEGGNSDGIGLRLNQNTISADNNYMTFYKSGNGVAGRIEGFQISDIADIPIPTEDEIWTAVCIGIADYNPVTFVWTSFANQFNLFSLGWNNITTPSFDIPDIPPFEIPDVPSLVIPDIPAFVITDVPGFTIPDIPGVTIPDIPSLTLGPYLCATINVCACPCDVLDPLNFNCCCVDEEICVIPEFTLFSGITIPDFPGIPIPDFPGIPIPDFPGITIPDFAGITIPDFPGLVIPEVPEVNLSETFGELPTIPTLSTILMNEGICPDEDIFAVPGGYVFRLVDWALENRLQSFVTFDPISLLTAALVWTAETVVMENGVVYGSTGADYAEYLRKLDADEVYVPGNVVGIHGGQISKVTENADQVLVISSYPVVLGNLPEDAHIDQYEKVAFLGQVPVMVEGIVEVGDYILPSGNDDGFGRAVSSEELSTDLLSEVIGVAWTPKSYADRGLVNTSIGLRPTEVSAILKDQQRLEESISEQLDHQSVESASMSNDLQALKEYLGLPVEDSNR